MTRKERRKEKNRKIINIIISFFIIITCLYIFINICKEERKNNNYITKKLYIAEEKIILNDEHIKYEKEYVDENYKGYEVCAKLVIPKIELETLVLKNFSENSLNTSVTKFWGPNANEIGNFCIVGHNFKKQNMFHNLKKLDIGDIVILKDNLIGIVEYEIYNKKIVVPENVECLSQETNGKREITLITCTLDSKKRIVIKAYEIL